MFGIGHHFVPLCFALFLTTATVAGYMRGRTPAILGHNSIASLESAAIGGMGQWLLIRGQDKANPVLLWLHGGPGSAQMPIARHYNGDLEKDFVVVHWDQRGAGKSNPRAFDSATMSTERFMQDVHEITQLLKTRFRQDKIFILGHSWGAELGIQVAHRWPDDYHAYIGVSQVVDAARGDEIGYNWLADQVKKDGSRRALRRLERLGPPPFVEHDRFVALMKLIDAYGGGSDASPFTTVLVALGSTEYCVSDYARWLNGALRGSGPMWEKESAFNLFNVVDDLQVPAYFFCGVRDYNTPTTLVEEFCSALNAPRGKRVVRFENSAHSPFIAEPDKFNAELLRVRDEVLAAQA